MSDGAMDIKKKAQAELVLSAEMTQVRHDDNHAWFHPWEYLPEAGVANRTIVTRAEGIYLYDEFGRRLIDGHAGMWCNQIGYSRREMADAIADQVMQVAYMNPFSLTSSPATRLAARLAALAPGKMNHVFFTTGGSTAVETALRFVHIYNNLRGRRGKKHIISREEAYHGSTYLCGLVTGKQREANWFDIESPLVHFLSCVNPMLRAKGVGVDEFCDQRVQELEDKILELGPESVGAFIAEPIQASGGVVVPPDGYIRRCWEVCKRHDVLFIADEVVTAFGRLGHWFASGDVYGIEPDMITCAKGLTSGYLPLGACLVSDRLFEEIAGEKSLGASFGHGFTYSGHPVCCTAALKNMDIIEREGLLAHVRAIGPYFQQQLQLLRDIPLVFDVRGQGLLGCVECTVRQLGETSLDFDTGIGTRIERHCHELGLMVRPFVNKCVFSPPLIIDKQQVDEMIAILREGIRRTMDDLQEELGLS